jgi:hypothetical protein
VDTPESVVMTTFSETSPVETNSDTTECWHDNTVSCCMQIRCRFLSGCLD